MICVFAGYLGTGVKNPPLYRFSVFFKAFLLHEEEEAGSLPALLRVLKTIDATGCSCTGRSSGQKVKAQELFLP